MYGVDQGLTNPTILALCQDREGYIWVSTEGGLFRYDGDRFRHFQDDPVAARGDTYSLHSSPDGQFWVGSGLGLFRWTGSRFAAVPGFEQFALESGQAIASDPANLYVATAQGLWSMPLKGGSPPRLLSPKRSRSVFVAADHTIWYTCGLAICSLQKGVERQWLEPDGVTSGNWSSFAQDSGGRLWVRCKDKVLVRESAGLPFHALPRMPVLSSTRAVQLVCNRLGQTLIPHDAGLMICQGEDCQNFDTKNGLEHAEVMAALEDREYSLWVGYSGHGLGRWIGRNEWEGYSEPEGLADASVWRIVRDTTGDLWVGTTHGIFHGTRQGGEWRFHYSDVAGKCAVYALAADPDGSLWVGTYQSQLHGILRYDPHTGRKVLYPPAQPFPQWSVFDIYRDADGTIWVATPRGLMFLPPGGTELEFAPLPAITGASISDIKTDRAGMYVTGKRGIWIQQDGFHRLLSKANGLKDNWVQSVVPGPEGELWIDYFSAAGITRIDVMGGKIHLRHYSVEDGLPSNVVYSQFFDSAHRHWLATDSGLAVYEKGRWSQYSRADGLIWDDCNAHSYLADADGSIWVGTSGGLSHYHPVDAPEFLLPKALITSVTRNDVPTVGTDFDSSLHSLGLRFTMLSYLRQNPMFHYRLRADPADPWVETQAREVRFAELPPGSYRFEVQGEVNPGIWSQTAALDFRIRAPWYRSLPFRVGLLFLCMAGVWLCWRWREAGQRRIRAALELAVEQRTRDLNVARAHAEEASRVKSEFVANISHEMRTPLNAVIGFAHLASQIAKQPEVAEYLRNVHLSAKGLLDLINEILEFSKLESDKVEIVPEPLALRPFVADLTAIFRPEAVSKMIELKTIIDGSAPAWVLADQIRLRQVLVNLLGNAIKFTSQGAVTLRVEHSAGRLTFSVTDTGIGIPAEKQGVVFEAFHQADNSTSRRYGGTGLGLTISKKLVEFMGGQLSLSSESGKGSTFGFTIDAPPTAPPAAMAIPPEEAPTRPMRVLVAEDNRVNQLLMLALLRKRGHTATVASDGAEALAALERQSFDLVLMDIQMPEMDGLEAVRCIRKGEASTGRRLPVVAMTARAMAGDREAFLAAGMDDYLEKPVQIDRLDAVLHRIASRLPPFTGSPPAWNVTAGPPSAV